MFGPSLVVSVPMSALSTLLDTFRAAGRSERERGTYFEELILAYLRTEPLYKELYATVETYAAWASRRGLDRRDAGIDLVAETFGGDVHAIQCKLYAADYRVQKSDIDSFFTASGKRPFTHRVIVATTSAPWGELAEDALRDQQPEVNKIDLAALEQSVIDWSRFAPRQEAVVRPKKALRQHQVEAVEAVERGLADRDRGKLIMACGTGKTFTSLKIAERMAGRGKRVLFLVPSLSLLSQTLTEWTQESAVRLRSFAVCSDSDVGKKRKKDDDVVQTFAHELQFPATTRADRLAAEVLREHDGDHMTVVFATYHSIDVIHRAQRDHELSAFDLIVCDEAHRTTGATFDGEEESAFVRIHDSETIRGAKRLYMTATPRIFGETAKATAGKDSVTLCSMDDPGLFGDNLFVLTFSSAVKRRLLVDYKVIVLAVEEKHVSRRIQDLLKDENNDLRVDDAAKIVGCWKALAKQGLTTDLADDASPMKRAVAFCQVIRPNPQAKQHKVASTAIQRMFSAVVEAYRETASEEERAVRLRCEAEHIDGGMNASQKEEKIRWLKDEPPEETCRVLSNVRCLSEGVDVPALDAVLFLTPRNSQVDVVQSVGRVMRTTPEYICTDCGAEHRIFTGDAATPACPSCGAGLRPKKQRGYVVLPVVIPASMAPHEALNDNETYRVVWQVLQALRSHDDRFDAMINKLELTGADPRKMEVIAVTDKVVRRSAKRDEKADAKRAARGGRTIGAAANNAAPPEQMAIEFDIGEIEKAIYAKVVEKVGNRHHWEDWAKDIAKIAATHIDRITGILDNPANERERQAFDAFARELRDDLNDSITRGEIIEMLAQHLVTRPVFEALFAGHSFVAENSMSKAMQAVLDVLDEHHIGKEATTLQAFYDSVKMRAEGIENAAGKQKIVVELYDKFFRNAFPKMSERLGIVYTPVEIVDFILHSVDHLLREEFGQTLGSEGVHILDPFTGTGTFITRLLASGLITPQELPRKYREEIHANELVLLAYYIAAINIEAMYHDLVGGDYVPFEGICLTDTFQLYEKDDLVSLVLADNSARRTRQKKLDIRVIIGNPPYSVGKDSQNDESGNVAYPGLDERIASTYVAVSSAALSRNLYDSYVRAIRWASDRVGASGIVGFVTNAAFIEASTADGLRKCLVDEFSSIYVFHLRGNQRTAGERSKREGGKVFGSGSRAPVAISLLVKNPGARTAGCIFFRDVGDYLTREQKLEAVASFGGVAGITASDGWTRVEPDAHGDWLKQRIDSYSQHIAAADKDKRASGERIFATFSLGVVTNRDAWAYAYSRADVSTQMTTMIGNYNAEVLRLDAMHPGAPRKAREAVIDGFIDRDATKVSWSRGLKNELAKGTVLSFDQSRVIRALYRPYSPMWLYFDRKLNEMVLQIPRLFPTADSVNRVIGVSAGESRAGFSVIMTDLVPSLHAADMVGSQYFPMYVYDVAPTQADEDVPEGADGETVTLFVREPAPTAYNALASATPVRRDGITDAGLAHFQSAYPGEAITKEDLFYYVYGVLHSPEYRERYADNLGKELPRIPKAPTAEAFWAFSKAGRALGELHVGYESVPEYPARVEGVAKPTPAQLRVEGMKFGKGKDKTVIHYNAFFTVRDIPLAAYEYVVNGKPAVEWVMERQAVTTDKASGIVKDANAWAIETVGDPRYPLSLLLRVITVSLETMKIVKALPALLQAD
jgi:predicted helicase